MPNNAPKFLDLDLDDQQQRDLLQAWMYSEPPSLFSDPNEATMAHSRHASGRLAQYDPSALTEVYSAGTQIQFTIPDLVIDIPGGAWDFLDFFGQATATAAPVYLNDAAPASVFSHEEPESASIEDERVITFRPIHASIRRAIQPTNVRLSPDAIRFVTRARGRRLRFEEEPETQFE